MRRDFLRTLFSRMLATYLTVALGLVVLVGVTVVALFQSQIRFEMEAVLSIGAADNSAPAPRTLDEAEMSKVHWGSY